MKRILICGKNKELSREPFSRAARSKPTVASPQTDRAVFYSGAVPGSAAGGTRLFHNPGKPHTQTRPVTSSPRLLQPDEKLEVTPWVAPVLFFIFACAFIFWMTVAFL